MIAGKLDPLARRARREHLVRQALRDRSEPPVILVLPVNPAEWGRPDLWGRQGLRGIRARRARLALLALRDREDLLDLLARPALPVRRG